jgi:hypothetical protein
MMDKPRWTEFKKDENDELPGETLFPFITKQHKTIRNQKNKITPKKVKESELSEVTALIEKEESSEESDDEYKFTKFHILDKKLPPLKIFYRPYFSPKRGSCEIDYMHSGTFTFGRNSHFRFYLVCMNINTKYAVVFPMNLNEHYDTQFSLWCIKKLMNNAIVTNIRADDNMSFSHVLNEYLRSEGITPFYSGWKHINKNRVVDRFIRTIRDAIGLETSLILNPNIVEDIVYLYNRTPHAAFFNRFTPYQAQHDPDIENWYIHRQQLELYKIQRLQLREFGRYKNGNILMIHVPRENTEERFKKRRRNLD